MLFLWVFNRVACHLVKVKEKQWNLVSENRVALTQNKLQKNSSSRDNRAVCLSIVTSTEIFI